MNASQLARLNRAGAEVADRVAECRHEMLDALKQYVRSKSADEVYAYVMADNIEAVIAFWTGCNGVLLAELGKVYDTLRAGGLIEPDTTWLSDMGDWMLELLTDEQLRTIVLLEKENDPGGRAEVADPSRAGDGVDLIISAPAATSTREGRHAHT